jgi:formylglycine-generating enzyme required for sulfatase activity
MQRRDFTQQVVVVVEARRRILPGARGPVVFCLLVGLIVPEAPAGAAGARADRVLVPGGPFTRGSTRALDERPVETRRLASFRIDRTEVTRGQYARCVAARRCKSPPVDLARDVGLPVTQVSWHEARAYCAFAGGRLPTEDQWEKAARGTDGREFPWGQTLDCTHANWGNFDGEGPCAGANPGRPVPVGQYPGGASPYGILDLGGNVWEWVETAYEDEPGRRLVRGGSCCSYFVEPRAANRNAWAPQYRDGDLGFRCVSK